MFRLVLGAVSRFVSNFEIRFDGTLIRHADLGPLDADPVDHM